MLKIILEFYNLSREKLKAGMDFEKIIKLPIWEKISRLKYISEDKLSEFNKVESDLRSSYV